MRITFDDNYASTYEKAYPYMKKKGLTGICFVVVDLIGKPDRMTVEQLLELQNNGWEIGSHTLSHPDLTKLDPVWLIEEILGSKVKLFCMGFDIKAFAYPYGKYNNDCIHIVEIHYEWARSCYQTDGTKWTKPAYNLVNKLEGVGYPMVHSIDQPQYRSNITMEKFRKLCRTLV